MTLTTFKLYFILVITLFAVNAYGALRVIAAENFYGHVAKELGGPYVDVTNILDNPNQDPHLFTISPRTFAQVQSANIIIFNGANYDPWIQSLLTQYSGVTLNVAKLLNVKQGENPHIWYAPHTMPIFAKALVDLYIRLDPSHKNYFIQQLKSFNENYQALNAMINEMQAKFNNIPIIATEPLFNEMAKSIGFKIHGIDFQESIMNDIPPSVSQIKAFEDNLNHHSVRLLIYNEQVSNPMTNHMLMLAKKNGIPVVGITETLPAGETFVSWMLNELTEIKNALQPK